MTLPERTRTALPGHVRVVEVGPRDGLQNEAATVEVAARVALIEQLAAAGLQTIECGAFVSPRRVPQMAGSAQVFGALGKRPGCRYTALVPNLRGLEEALAAGADEVAVFGAASESFAQHNIRCSIAESIERFAPLCEQALAHGVRVRGYLSCAAGCPYEGEVAPAKVAALAAELAALGCYEIALGDTIGTGTPLAISRLIEQVCGKVPPARLAVHFHDTYGQALVNTWAALQMGVAVVDGSVAGLGGCPYAPGAGGNLATEDLVYLLHGLGIETGVDLEALVAAAWAIARRLRRTPASRVAAAMPGKQAP